MFMHDNKRSATIEIIHIEVQVSSEVYEVRFIIFFHTANPE